MADASAMMVDDHHHNIPTNNDKDDRIQRLEKELLDLQKERKSTNPFSTVHRWIDVMSSDIEKEIASLRNQRAHVHHIISDDDRDDIGFIFEADEETDEDDRQALRTPPTQHHISTTMKKEEIEKSPTAATLFSSIDDLSIYDDNASLSVITQGRSLPPLSPSRASAVVSPCPQEVEEEDTDRRSSKSSGGFIPDHFLFPIAMEEKEFIPDHFLFPIATEEKDTRKKYDKAKSSFDWYIDEDKFCLYKH